MNATKIADETIREGFAAKPHLTVTAWADDGSTVISYTQQKIVEQAIKQGRTVAPPGAQHRRGTGAPPIRFFQRSSCRG